MKHILPFSLLLLYGATLIYMKAYRQESPAISQPVQTGPALQSIPGSLTNFRSAQPDENELRNALASGMILHVVRLNGDGKDAGSLSIEAEKAICEEYGVQFSYVNIEGNGGVERIHQALMQGGTYLHCLHGYDRTGAAAAYHLRKLGFDQAAVIEHNGWEGYVERKGEAYRKYFNFTK